MEFLSKVSDVVNVRPNFFGGPMRAGDILGVCNFLEHVRKVCIAPHIKFHIVDEAVRCSEQHCVQMRDFLIDHTDYLAHHRGEDCLLKVGPTEECSDNYNLWNIRKDVLYRKQDVFHIDDAISISHSNPYYSDKVVVCPVMDAPYNKSRNWSLEYLQNIIDKHSSGECVLLSKTEVPGLRLGKFKYSHKYLSNLNHIMECSVYIGGDTGLSHFAAALIPRPTCFFHYPKDTYGTTNPFYWKSRGHMIYY